MSQRYHSFKDAYEKVYEGKKELPLAKMSLKASELDGKSYEEEDTKKRHKLEDRARMIRIMQNKGADK